MRFGLYIHIPFCRRKCPYCSFVSFVHCDDYITSYIDSLIKEYTAKSTGIFNGSPHTLYIGGGTPSLLSHHAIKRLLENIDTSSTYEITFEVNPESCNPDLIGFLRDEGVTRISLGIQSLDNKILQNLGRIHNASQAINSYHTIRDYDFDSVSVDLMFGVPGQTMEIWKRTVEEIISLGPDHISAYSLGIEEDTEYFRDAGQGKLQIPGQSETTDMYFLLYDLTHKAGYEWYEISNFARPGKESLHNSGYWDFTPYLGAGVSAHSFDGRSRRWNTSDIHEYLHKILSNGDATESYEENEGRVKKIEQIMLPVRTRNGITIESLDLTKNQAKEFENVVDEMKSAGFLEMTNSGLICITIKGAAIIDEIISEMITAVDGL